MGAELVAALRAEPHAMQPHAITAASERSASERGARDERGDRDERGASDEKVASTVSAGPEDPAPAPAPDPDLMPLAAAKYYAAAFAAASPCPASTSLASPPVTLRGRDGADVIDETQLRQLSPEGHYFEHGPIGFRQLHGHLTRPSDPSVHFVRVPNVRVVLPEG